MKGILKGISMENFDGNFDGNCYGNINGKGILMGTLIIILEFR